jgi:hypothetical protein
MYARHSEYIDLVATGESEPHLYIRKGQVRVAGGVPRLACVGANLFYLSETQKLRLKFFEKALDTAQWIIHLLRLIEQKLS